MQVLERAPLLGLGQERTVDRARERSRQVPAAALQRPEPGADAPGRGGRRRPAHRVHAGEALVQDERQRIQIGGRTGLVPLALLGRHIRERAEHVAGARERVFARESRSTEIGELGHATALVRLAGNEHVLGLDIAMNNAVGMGMGERVGQREADLEQFLVDQRLGGEQLREGVAVDQLGDQVEGVLRGARLVQDDDRRVCQTRAGECLTAGALAVDRIAARPERDPLDRNLAVQQLVVGAPHHPEAACAEALEQAVAAEHQRLPDRTVVLVDAPWGRTRESRRRRDDGFIGLEIAWIRMPGAGVDEGVERVHHLPSSPPSGSPPAPPGRKRRREREVAGLRAGCPPVILGHFDSPREGVIGFCRSSTMARRQRPGRRLEHHGSHDGRSRGVRSMARTSTRSTSTR